MIGLGSNDSSYNRRGRTWCCAEPRASLGQKCSCVTGLRTRWAVPGHFSEGVRCRRIGLKWDVVKSNLPSRKLQEFQDKRKKIIVFPYPNYRQRKKMLFKMKKKNKTKNKKQQCCSPLTSISKRCKLAGCFRLESQYHKIFLFSHEIFHTSV